MRFLALTLLLAPFCVQGAELNKCSDAFGRVTYTSESCAKEGLNPAGAIRDRVTVLPVSSPASTHKQAPKKDEQRPLPTVKPVVPLVDQLAK